jgi:NADH-quinone oxidoreductase subunit N
MTRSQLIAIFPLIAVTATVVVAMLGIAFKRHHRATVSITVVGFNLALVALLPSVFGGDTSVVRVTDLIVVDGASRLGMVLVLVTTLGVLTMCPRYFEGYRHNREEVYLLLGVGTLGGLTLTCAHHAASLLLGLELLSLPLVGAVAYAMEERRAIEGGVKYLVLSAAATATLMFGIALIYAAVGALDVPALSDAIAEAGFDSPLVLAGAAMLLAGLAFKLSLVPFHQWTPDVYEAAPLPVTAYLSTVAKLGAFIATLRLFHAGAGNASPLIVTAIVGLALASMLIGSVLALRQTNLKRLLAYSSITNFGYLAVLLALPGLSALRAAGIFLAAYLITTLGVFGVMTVLSSPMQRDREELAEYQGLFWHRPYLASILVALLLSLAGVPLTSGFIGKLVVIGESVRETAYWLIGGVVIASAISVYYYLRVMAALVRGVTPGTERVSEPIDWAYRASGAMLLAATLLTIWLGVYPQPLFDFGGQLLLP